MLSPTSKQKLRYYTENLHDLRKAVFSHITSFIYTSFLKYIYTNEYFLSFFDYVIYEQHTEIISSYYNSRTLLVKTFLFM